MIWGKTEKLILFPGGLLVHLLETYSHSCDLLYFCQMPLHVWLCGFTMVDVSAEAAEVLVLGVTVVNGHPCIAYSHQTQMPQYPHGCTLIEPTPP